MISRLLRALIGLFATAAVMACLTGATGLFRGEPPAADPPAPQGAECLGRVDIDGGVLDLAPVRAGRVAVLPVREGEAVPAGAVLLRLDEQAARLLVQQAEAARRAAEAQVALAEEAARLHPSQVAGQEALAKAARCRAAAAREAQRRQERLHGQNLISNEERDAARDEAKALEAVADAEAKRLDGLRDQNPTLRVQQARAEAARAEALVAEARHGLEQCVVRAPEAGRLLRRRCGVGEVVSPQAAVLAFAPARPYIVRAEVEQELVHLVEVGRPAVVTDEMNPQRSWTGRVARVGDWYADSPAIPRRMARFTDLPTVECVIALDPGHPPLRLGQRMTVRLGDR
ncbi:MAG: HlyD family efflux transporter periplasmic adaptor subunit [Gemmataceae bacterium]